MIRNSLKPISCNSSLFFHKVYGSLNKVEYYNISKCKLNTSHFNLNQEKSKEEQFIEFVKKNYKNVNVYKDGIRIAREEIKVLKEEMIDSFILNRRNAESPIERDGVIDMLFKFECEEDLDYFTVTTDSSNNRGYSSASLKITEEGTALFSGNISTEVPKDGNVKYTGYANIMSGRKLKSFYRESYYNWTAYTHLVLKVRGDGRTYTILLPSPGKFESEYEDKYFHPLYTRGGPYWQVTRIPFRHFLFSKDNYLDGNNKGTMNLDKIAKFGITLDDANSGPFKLEIDYVGLQFSFYYRRESPYEMYYLQPYSSFA
ncbi:conserved hypothetical protein [Pediculus humanus corporis]|uniref:NADH:ubiquinone oxidoreductase intermediate-associated protein 30 domain-containing protein n=1 Tax=Pediculus humanus subsp. corporis TaxID=121224 RepID=E0VYG8_PEDHC|nr:uncharacterized protein Phum_PHUM514070 [Pediculus humanus corporis]EEB18424.1 conserved hypothetical protein [Pediculus humanus corporis]